MSRGIRKTYVFLVTIAVALFMMGSTAVYGLEDNTESAPSGSAAEIAKMDAAVNDGTKVAEGDNTTAKSAQPEYEWVKSSKGLSYVNKATGKAVTGWQEIDGKKYYMNSAGIVQTGWKFIQNIWYYFDSTGVMQTGWEKVNGSWYFLDREMGAMHTGWVDDGGRRYYLAKSGAMKTGWVKSEGIWYYLDDSGAMETGWKKLNGVWYFLDRETGAMHTYWAKDGDTWYHMNGSGAMDTGWLKSGGKWYYLDGSGAMQTGWKKLSGSWYFLDRETGAMHTYWAKDGDTWYHMNGNGAMDTGWLKSGGKWYYLNGSGAMQTGWEKVSGFWYLLDRESGDMKTGWIEDGDKWYHLADSGKMDRRRLIIYEKGAYYLGDSGAMETSECTYMKGITLHPDSSGLISLDEYKKHKSQIDAMEYARWVLNTNGRSLWDAFLWSGSKIDYKKLPIKPEKGSAYYANIGFNEREGNCYTMAGTFLFMALDLGYDARQVAGYTDSFTGGGIPHSWIEVYENGQTYVYDPNIYQEYGRVIFGLKYKAKGTLAYLEDRISYMHM